MGFPNLQLELGTVYTFYIVHEPQVYLNYLRSNDKNED